jgi:hypothetical protein
MLLFILWAVFHSESQFGGFFCRVPLGRLKIKNLQKMDPKHSSMLRHSRDIQWAGKTYKLQHAKEGRCKIVFRGASKTLAELVIDKVVN